jgi:hypothetical protein
MPRSFLLAGTAVPLAAEDRRMVFSFHYSAVMAYCRLEFVLPWAGLAPFLSGDGRRWLEAMRTAGQR